MAIVPSNPALINGIQVGKICVTANINTNNNSIMIVPNCFDGYGNSIYLNPSQYILLNSAQQETILTTVSNTGENLIQLLERAVSSVVATTFNLGSVSIIEG